MNRVMLAALIAGTATLGACSTYEDDEVVVPVPVGVGVIVGTVAADRNGDGIVDGYYTSDGVYHAFQAPPCPTPPVQQMPAPNPSGERG